MLSGGFLLVIAAVIGWLAAWAVIAAVLYVAIARAFKISDYSADEIANRGDMHPPFGQAKAAARKSTGGSGSNRAAASTEKRMFRTHSNGGK